MSDPLASRRELLSRATERPWATGFASRSCTRHQPGRHPGPPDCVYDHITYHDEAESHGIYSRPVGDDIAGNYDYEQGGIINPSDAALIVQAVNDYEALLEIAEAAREYREEFAKRGIQTAESMAAWERLNAALARLQPIEKGKR